MCAIQYAIRDKTTLPNPNKAYKPHKVDKKRSITLSTPAVVEKVETLVLIGIDTGANHNCQKCVCEWCVRVCVCVCLCVCVCMRTCVCVHLGA